MADTTYNPLSDSSIEPDNNQSTSSQSEDDLGSEIASQITGQSYTDDSGSKGTSSTGDDNSEEE